MFELLSINPVELTEKDAEIWNKLKNYISGSVTPAMLDDYRKDVKESKNESRMQFRAIIFSQLSILLFHKINKKNSLN